MLSNINVPVAATALAGVAAVAIGARVLVLPMIRKSSKTFMVGMLDEAGIVVGRDVDVVDDDMWLDWTLNGMLGIGEAYMAGQWACHEGVGLDEVLTKLMLLPSSSKRRLFKSWNARFAHLAQRFFNYQSSARAVQVAEKHYNLPIEFFRGWLDKNMQYSCAYWKGAANLEQAQINKMRLIGDKLKLEPGMTVLEIGCGWGGLGCFLAKHYGVHVTGITISTEQLKEADAWAVREGVQDKTSFEFRDYREQEGQFDRVVSIAMLEAVGYKNLDEYYEVIKRNLKMGGIALVHSIAATRSTTTAHQMWVTRYIFPNGFLPSIRQMCEYAEKKFVVEDVHNIGPDYDPTLMAWEAGFQKRIAAGDLEKFGLDQTFSKMWSFYLCYCAAGFRARTIQLYQQVLSKHRPGRYDAPR